MLIKTIENQIKPVCGEINNKWLENLANIQMYSLAFRFVAVCLHI